DAAGDGGRRHRDRRQPGRGDSRGARRRRHRPSRRAGSAARVGRAHRSAARRRDAAAQSRQGGPGARASAAFRRGTERALAGAVRFARPCSGDSGGGRIVNALVVVFWICFAIVGGTYVGYPLLVGVWARLFGRPVDERWGLSPPETTGDCTFAVGI